MMSTTTLKWLNVFSFLFMLILNYAANALPLNGMSTGALSDLYPNLFVPAGFTFSIWGVIYMMILYFVFWQFRSKNESDLKQLSILFALSSLFNGLWILAWHYLFIGTSVLIMLALLAVLVGIQIQFEQKKSTLIRTVFGVYLGWITVATCANLTALLVSLNWNGFGISAESWTLTLIIIAIVLASVLMNRFVNYAITWSVMWALFGILSKREQDFPTIYWTALIGIIVLISAQFWLYFSKKSPKLITN